MSKTHCPSPTTKTVDRLPLTAILPAESDFSSPGEDYVACPHCGNSYVEAGKPYIEESNDDYGSTGHVRGDLLVVPFMCEGYPEHGFEVCFGFHKGATAAFVRNGRPLLSVVPDSDPVNAWHLGDDAEQGTGAPTSDRLLNNAEAAAVLGLKPRALVKLRDLGVIPFVNLQNSATGYRYSALALTQFIADHQQRNERPSPTKAGNQ